MRGHPIGVLCPWCRYPVYRLVVALYDAGELVRWSVVTLSGSDGSTCDACQRGVVNAVLAAYTAEYGPLSGVVGG